LGRLSPEKGIEDLIRAWALTGTTRVDELLVAGSGPQRKKLEVLARELGARVRFLGHVDAARRDELLASVACCVVPSRIPETFGLVVAEASLHGCPCVVADVGALVETLGGKSCGTIVPPADIKALAEGIAAALDEPEAAAAAAERARAHALAAFSEEEFLARLAYMLWGKASPSRGVEIGTQRH
jgi:glycosyltransferase involved in cell wall biosynthesis